MTLMDEKRGNIATEGVVRSDDARKHAMTHVVESTLGTTTIKMVAGAAATLLVGIIIVLTANRSLSTTESSVTKPGQSSAGTEGKQETEDLVNGYANPSNKVPGKKAMQPVLIPENFEPIRNRTELNVQEPVNTAKDSAEIPVTEGTTEPTKNDQGPGATQQPTEQEQVIVQPQTTQPATGALGETPVPPATGALGETPVPPATGALGETPVPTARKNKAGGESINNDTNKAPGTIIEKQGPTTEEQAPDSE